MAGPENAQLLESLAAPQPRRTRGATTLSAASRRDAFARARTCYDHLAGRLGVAVADAMTTAGLLDWTHDVALTPAGSKWLAGLGIEVRPTRGRPPVRSCLDATERRPHIAGPVGAALCGHAMAQGWVTRIPGGRALRLTADGRRELGENLGLTEGVLTELS